MRTFEHISSDSAGSELLCRYIDSLRGGRSRNRIPWEARFSAPVQTDPGAHPPSPTIGTRSFLGVNWKSRSVNHPPTPSAEVKEKVVLYLYSPSGPSWPVLGWSTSTPRCLKILPSVRRNDSIPKEPTSNCRVLYDWGP